MRRAVATSVALAALTTALPTFAAAQSGAWPFGRQQLPWLEGRWSSGDCQASFTEYRFTGANNTGLTFSFGPATTGAKMNVDVYYDADGKVVLYFPSISFRTIVTFRGKDARDTLDIDKDGKVTKSSYRRCLP